MHDVGPNPGPSRTTTTWQRWAMPLLVALFVVVAIVLAMYRHAAFQTQLLDLGYYTQVLWNTAHGRWFATSIKPPNYLADHFSPILATLAPLFLVWPDARTLLVVSALALVTAIFPGYAVLRRRHASLAPFLVLCFILNPMLQATAVLEFHEIMLAVPLLAIAAYAAVTDRPRILILSLVLTLLVREDMGIYVASFGLYVLLRNRKRWRLGVLLAIMGVAWLLLVTGYVMPALGAAVYRHANQYLTEGTSILDVLRNPLQLTRAVLTGAKLSTLIRVFAPLAFLPFLAAGEQLLWLPALFILLASTAPAPSALSGWYVAPLLPLLWFSVAQALARWNRRNATLGMGALLVASTAGFLLLGSFPGGRGFNAETYAITNHTRAGHDVLENIGADESVAIQNNMGAHVATRQQLYLFPWFDWSNAPSAIVLDERDSNPYPLTPVELQASVRQLQMEPSVQVSVEQDGYFIFRIQPAPTFPRMSPLFWPPVLRLDGYELAQADTEAAYTPQVVPLVTGQTLRVMLYLTALQRMDRDLAVSVRLVTPDGRMVAQDDNWPARGLLPTTRWVPDRTVRDTHYVPVPESAATTPLSLVVLVYDSQTLETVSPAAGHTLTTWAAP